MAVSVEVPNLGEEMAGGVVAEWYLADGAEVAAGDLVCRVECSFVAVEVEAPGDGLLRHGKPAGSIEHPGTVLGHILGEGEAVPRTPGPASATEPEQGPPSAPSDAIEAPDFQFELEEERPHPEAVVVPFPRRFAPQREPAWEPAPGDAVEFASSFFEPAGEPADELPEPGGSIPGLPLWEPEDERAGAATYDDDSEERFSRIAAEVETTARVGMMSVHIDVTECKRMLAVCEREWRSPDVVPLLEDLVIRATAKAAREAGLPAETAGIVIIGGGSDTSGAVAGLSFRPLREAVHARASGSDGAFEAADFVLTSFVAQGIATATPLLQVDSLMAFALGAPGRDGLSALTMAYESARLGEGGAARLLGRVRDILEAPYAMLV